MPVFRMDVVTTIASSMPIFGCFRRAHIVRDQPAAAAAAAPAPPTPVGGGAQAGGWEEMTRPRHTTITHDPAHIPQGQFDWLEGKRVVRCATGNTHAVLLLDTGEVVTVASDSGGNEHGQLARGNKYESMSASQRMMMAFTNQQPPPIPEHARHMCIPRLVIELTHVKQIASSAAHCAAVAVNGTLFTWGANGQGQCGFSEAALAQYYTEIRALPEYQQENWSQYPDHDRLSATHCNVGALADPSVKVTFVTCGAYHTIALTAGTVNLAPISRWGAGSPTASRRWHCQHCVLAPNWTTRFS